MALYLDNRMAGLKTDDQLTLAYSGLHIVSRALPQLSHQRPILLPLHHTRNEKTRNR